MRNRSEVKESRINRKLIMKGIKSVLFIMMVVLTYFVSDKVVDYLLSLDAELLKRSLNIILVIITVFIYTFKKES